MSRNPSQTLKLLFAIEQAEIDRDLERAKKDLLSLANEISALLAIPFNAKTPRTDARLAHLLLLQAHELSRRAAMAPELRTFYAAFGAGHVAQDAESIAADKDMCLELTKHMDAIRVREGLKEDELWVTTDEGPEDYRRLNEEFGRVLERVADTVFTFVLRRYRIDEQADLFEGDRVLFESYREVGRRVVFPSRDIEIEKMMDDYFASEYGIDALQRVKSRAGELRKQGRVTDPLE
jgi:hypothetical protein